MKRAPGLLTLVGGLALATLVLAQAVSFAVVGWWPAPPAPTMVPAEAIDALAGTAPAAPGLRIRSQASAPEGVPVPWLRDAAAERMQRPVSHVRAVWRTAPDVPLQVISEGRLSAAPGDARRAAQVRAALLAPGLQLPPFELALAQPDGAWRVVGTADAGRGQWRLQVLSALLLGAVLIAPLAWWMARRLTRPLRRLAEVSADLDLGAREQPVPLAGAAEVRVLGQAIADARRRLRAQSEDVTAMVAAVAHDLRTPLTGLRLRADGIASPERERMIADLQRMETMIAQVLAYAQGEVAPLQRAPVDMAALARELVAPVQADGRHAQVQADTPGIVQGDALALRRALSNLVDNAVRYAGAVEIVIREAGGDLHVDVNDRGPGIPDDARARLVQPFQRLEHSRSRDTGGVGLGLAVARSVAQRHGGALELQTRRGGGLRARLRLPLDP